MSLKPIQDILKSDFIEPCSDRPIVISLGKQGVDLPNLISHSPITVFCEIVIKFLDVNEFESKKVLNGKGPLDQYCNYPCIFSLLLELWTYHGQIKSGHW